MQSTEQNPDPVAYDLTTVISENADGSLTVVGGPPCSSGNPDAEWTITGSTARLGTMTCASHGVTTSITSFTLTLSGGALKYHETETAGAGASGAILTTETGTCTST
jgi:hypothetical protein